MTIEKLSGAAVEATGEAPLAGRKEWTALAVLCLPLLVVSMDVSVLFFASPFIARALHPTAVQQLWIFDIYGFILAGLLLTMGAVGDRIGRRRLLMIGGVGFALTSLLAAFSTSAGELILARALLGIAGSSLMPSSIALVRTMFPNHAQRMKAMATWSSVLAGGVTLGPIVSGLLLDNFSWGAVFLINVPAMALLLVVAPILLPESKSARPSRIDWGSSALALVAILGTTYGVKTLAENGWAALPAATLIVGVAVGIAFVLRQLRLEHPLIDVRALRERRTGGSILINLIGTFALMASSVVITQFLQSVLGLDPLIAALWSVAPAVGVGAAAPIAGALAGRVGRPAVMAGGLLVSAGGFAVLTQVQLDGFLPLAVALVGAGLVAAGLVSVTTLVADYVMGVTPIERAGAVGGLIETSSELGGAFGIAILGTVLAAVYHAAAGHLLPASLTGAARTAAEQTIAAAGVTAEHAGALGGAIMSASRAAYMTGMHTTSLVGCGILVITAVLTLVLLRGREHRATAA